MISTVIFDFDGTIINTNRLIEEGLNYFSHRYRGRNLSLEELNALTGKPLEEQMVFINEEKAELIAEQFKIWYAHHHNARATAFPGVIELIKKLYTRGHKLAIVTNNSKAGLNLGMRHLGLERYFHMTVTKEDVHLPKPSPEGITKVLKAFDSLSDEAIYVGDTEGDLLAAKGANVPSVLVGWSHIDGNHLKPDWVIRDAAELLKIIEASGQEVA